MRIKSLLSTEWKKAKKLGMIQHVWVYLFLLPILLFTLSGFTFIPGTAHAASMAISTSSSLALPMSALHPGLQVDDGCSDVITLADLSWTEIKIYLNDCALQHLNALTASFGAGAAFVSLISVSCEECAPIAVVLTFIAAVFTANIDFLQYVSQGCGGAYLDFSWFGGIQLEPACTTRGNGS